MWATVQSLRCMDSEGANSGQTAARKRGESVRGLVVPFASPSLCGPVDRRCLTLNGVFPATECSLVRSIAFPGGVLQETAELRRS